MTVLGGVALGAAALAIFWLVWKHPRHALAMDRRTRALFGITADRQPPRWYVLVRVWGGNALLVFFGVLFLMQALYLIGL